jgi:hypothetical protein
VGHGTGYSAEALSAATAEWLGFIMHRLGLMAESKPAST